MSAEEALGRAGSIISEVIKAVQEGQEYGAGSMRLSDEPTWLRSMLIALGETGRTLTYDHDAAALRSTLLAVAQLAYEWALEIEGKGILGPAWAINAEVHRAHEKHGSKSLLGDDSTMLERFAALAEECGEAADLIAPDARLKELIQVCSICVSWIAWLDVQPGHSGCTCPDGMRYHALNCPVQPGELRTRMIEVRDIRPDGKVLSSAVGPETMGIVFDYDPGFLPSGPFERQRRTLPDGEWETIRKFNEPLTDWSKFGSGHRCPAHGKAECEECHRGSGCEDDDDGGCAFWSSTGMHWDTCPNRIREPLGKTEAADEIVEAEIHGYCPCCPESLPAGTDRALVMAQNLAREVTAIGKRPGSYEIKVYADPDSTRPGHHHVRYTWLLFPPEGGAGRHPGPGGAGGIDEPGSGLGGQGSIFKVTPGWTVSQGGGSNPARKLEKPPGTPEDQIRAAQEYIRETYGTRPEADSAAITDGVINAGHAPERMLPPAINVTEGTVREAVGQAIGAASMTWGRPRKKAVFQEQVANQIATELLEFIVAYAGPEVQVIPGTVYAVMRTSVLGPVRVEAIYASAEKAYQEAGSSSYLVVQKLEVQP